MYITRHRLHNLVGISSLVMWNGSQHFINGLKNLQVVNEKWFSTIYPSPPNWFTSTFVTTVIELIQEGNSFSGIERMIMRKRQLYYVSAIAVQAKKLVENNSITCDDDNSIDILSTIPIHLLSHPPSLALQWRISHNIETCMISICSWS